MNLKGTLPVLILQVLASGPKHGYGIAREIKGRTRGILDFREGTLYPALHAHEKSGLITSFEETEKGRTRRYYELTPTGCRALEAERNEWRTVSAAVNLIMEQV